ncbi:hypothetical protein IAT38_006720 [Cryptococcus sp. DSM 104549]
MSSVPAGTSPAPPHLPSRSTYDSESNGSQGDDEDDYSSDDCDAVFFGSPKPQEAELIAKLSAAIPSTSSPFPSAVSPLASPPTTPLAPRVKKRDSREFLRRQTLLLTTEKRLQGGPLGLSERGPARAPSPCPSHESDSCSPATVRPNLLRTPPSSTPTLKGQADPSDLTFQFDTWHLSSPAAPNSSLPVTTTSGAGGAGVASGVADLSDSLDEGDSDKENMPVPEVNHNISEVQVMVMDEVVVSGGMAGLDLDDTQDEIAELDMGGLRLSDFEDPEIGHEQSGSRGYRGVLEDVTEALGPRRSMDEISLGSSGSEDDRDDCLAAEDGAPTHPSRSRSPTPTPTHSHTPSSHSTSSSPISLSSPLEVARAGPVAIPVLSSHHFASIRADVASPCRNLPPSPITRGPLAETGGSERREGVRLGALDSPEPVSQPPRAHTTQAALGLGMASATPSRPTALPPPELVQKGAKLLKASLAADGAASAGGRGPSAGTGVSKAPRPEKRAALVKTIRGQLDNAFSGRHGVSGMGVGQRSVSSGSSASARSAVSAASTASGMSEGGSRTGSKAMLSLASSSSSRSDSTLAATAAPAQIARKPATRPTAASAPAPAPTPSLGSSTTTTTVRGIPRPVLSTKTALPRPKAQILSSSTSGKPLAAAAGKSIPPPSSIPLKRTISQAQTQPQAQMGQVAPAHRGVLGPSGNAFYSSSGLALHARPVQTLGQSALASTPRSRPTLGQPTRVFRETMPPPLQTAPMFSVDVGGAGPGTQAVGMGRTGRSPGKAMGMFKKVMEKGTPRKLLGTPSRYGTPRQVPPFMPLGMNCAGPLPPAPAPLAVHALHTAPSSHAPQDVTPELEIITDGPPSSATRQATSAAAERAAPASPTPATGGASGSGSAGQRSGSDDGANGVVAAKTSPSADPSPPKKAPASTAAPSRSPSPKTRSTSRRPKRTIKPPQPPLSSEVIVKKTSAAGGTASGTIVPNMTEKELKMATHRNTMRNQVYHCAIDRQIVRQPGPRPPSPTSKIRTTSERDESERKKGREARAKRRGGVEDEEEEKPVIEKRTQMRGPGEEEDFVTPARPAKRAKTGAGGGGKSLKWDRDVTIIRDDGAVRAGSGSRDEGEEEGGKAQEAVGKSCIKTKVQLDPHGNVLESQRPVADLKRTRIVVTAVFYEGEEPVSTPSQATRSKKK